MAAYISVPRDLTKVKSKVAFNLTKRQLLCFGTAALIGVPLFFVLRDSGGNTAATLGMMAVMLPAFFLGMYEKNGQPLEKLLSYYVQSRFLRPKIRPYKTNNYYAILMKGGMTHALMKSKIIGVCPNCGKPVVEREKGWFCENRECRFVLWKDNAFFKRLGKRLDAHVADKLLRDGRVRLKDCKSAKGKTYNATVLLSCEADGRSKFSLEFEGGC